MCKIKKVEDMQILGAISAFSYMSYRKISEGEEAFRPPTQRGIKIQHEKVHEAETRRASWEGGHTTIQAISSWPSTLPVSTTVGPFRQTVDRAPRKVGI